MIQSEKICQILENYNVKELMAVFRNRYTNEGKLKSSQNNNNNLTSYRQLIIADLNEAEELVRLLANTEGIEQIYIEKPIKLKPYLIPDDNEYISQWFLNSTGNPLADINAQQAWDINTGRNDVIIAVCDGGVDYNHTDLDPGDRSRVIAGYDSGDDDEDPMDDLPEHNSLSYAGHGTHVAGIIGAITNNDESVSGIMWQCKIMPVKMVGSGTIKLPFVGTIYDFSTTAFPSDVADAIDYSINNGANVINLSYGFNDLGFPINEVILRVPLLFEVILNAYNSNIVIVAAMGNEYNEGDPTEYPAAFSNEVIAVGNTTATLQRANSSNTGPHIDLSAPGTGILSTQRGGGTTFKSGTSMAAPVVSGISGLLISQSRDRNLNITNDDVRHILETTTKAGQSDHIQPD